MSTEKNDEFAESIRPAVKGKSDKYSWRLYQRTKKNGRERVYLMAWNGLIGYQAPDPSCLEQGFVPASKIALGQVQDGFFHGGRLQTICTPGESLMDWAYSPAHHVAEWIDITDWFWSNYLRHGRCLFFIGVHRWTAMNRNTRKCEHCGKHERRSVVTRREIKRVEVWA